jgi:hypothetical protein
VFDQAARPADVKAGHGANGEGVKFSSATDLTKDTFADMTSKVVSYTADTLTANADAKTLYYRGYMAVPTAVETVIKPTVEAKATAATAADMTKFGTDGFIADDNYTYYTLTMAPASAAENLDQTNLYTIVARTFEYEAAVDTTVENGTGSVIGYQQVKTAVTAAAGLSQKEIRFSQENLILFIGSFWRNMHQTLFLFIYITRLSSPATLIQFLIKFIQF